jgi:hypothetical protein
MSLNTILVKVSCQYLESPEQEKNLLPLSCMEYKFCNGLCKCFSKLISLSHNCNTHNQDSFYLAGPQCLPKLFGSTLDGRTIYFSCNT